MGGQESFLDACRQSGSKEALAFLAMWRSLPVKEQCTTTLQDLCTRLDFDATDLVGSMMGKLIMQSNNHALLVAALGRPSLMRRSFEAGLGDDDIAFQERKLNYQIGGLIKGEGTQVLNLTQNVQGSGMMTFEEAAHQTVASVKAGGAPVIATTPPVAPFDANGEILNVQPEEN